MFIYKCYYLLVTLNDSRAFLEYKGQIKLKSQKLSKKKVYKLDFL